MRITPAVLKRSWLPAEKVEFQEILPLKLKTSVSGKGEKSNNVACIQEMTILFSCLKQNDFDQGKCNSEINNFQKCYSVFCKEKFERKELDKKGLMSPGSKDLNHKQLSYLLKKFP
uniref:CHCH domain-containing protein n=1 Tax=Clastoptera arizonana TaxID=38151 RepID=A0A1B6CUY9_9HEMI